MSLGDLPPRMAGDAGGAVNHHAAGIDIGSREHYVAVPEGRDRVVVRSPGNFAPPRGDRIYRRLQEEIGRKTMRIEASGEQIGQVNGLSVISLGNLAFGTPSRITAQVRLGRGEVVDIEREVELGGPLHSKGVLILGGFLGGRFGRTRPLSLNASLVFEQSYGGVDGDSASAASCSRCSRPWPRRQSSSAAQLLVQSISAARSRQSAVSTRR